MRQLILIFSIFISGATFADEEKVIDDRILVDQLNSIQTQLDLVTSNIMGCMDKGGDHSTCICDHQEIINRFNEKVNLFFTKNPGFINYDLVRFKSPDGAWVIQSLQGLRKQANSAFPSCR